MSKIVSDVDKDIPEAWRYVLCDDAFFSGWGRAEGKVNTCVFPCRNEAEVLWVAGRCMARPEMENVRVYCGKPFPDKNVLFSVFDRKEARYFYDPEFDEVNK